MRNWSLTPDVIELDLDQEVWYTFIEIDSYRSYVVLNSIRFIESRFIPTECNFSTDEFESVN